MRYEVEPFNDYVVFYEQEVKEIAGIYTPETGKTSAHRSFGRVIAVGPGRYDSDGKLIPMRSKVGDMIVLGARNSLVSYDHLDDARKVFAIREPEIAGRLKDDPGLYTHRGFDGERICGAETGTITE